MTDQNQAKKPSVSADERSLFTTIISLWPFIWPSDRFDLKMRVLLALLALLAAKAVTSVLPFASKAIVDTLGADPQTSGIVLGLSVPIALVLALGLGNIINSGMQQLRDILFARVGQHAVRKLSQITFVHLHRLSLRFHLSRRMGALSRVIERGVKGIESIVRFTVINTAPALLEFVIVGVVFTVLFGITMTSAVIVTVAAYIYFTIKTSNWRIGIRREMNESDSDANTKTVDSLLNFETVKYFGNEDMEAKRFDQSMAQYEKSATSLWTSLGYLNFGQGVIFWSGMTVINFMAVRGVMNGELTIGDYVLINTFMLQIYQPLNFIGFVYREIRQGLADIEEMFALLEQEPEVLDAPDARELKVEGSAIQFENVSFHYDPDRPILKNVSFEVPPGKTIALVGPSGAGKSTISRLIYRFYDCVDGRILIDGQDIKSVTQKSLREVIGMVPQDTVLFNETIAYNIQYGRHSASLDEVKHAAEMAQIADFIASLPQKFETMVGERGLKLSGGEKQRVAIARTILKAPPILLLDEATSALDTQTEQEIQSALDAVSADRTTLVIAHRLSTVINADEILVLQAGEIVERGSHQDLLTKDGLYAQMWQRQLEANQAEEQLRMTHEGDEHGFIKKVE